MSRTAINVGAVMDATSHINAAKTSVSSAKSAFTQTKNSIDGKIQNRANIRGRLNSVQTQLSGIDAQIGRIRATVQSGANMYRTTDDRVESWRDDIKNNVGTRAADLSIANWASYFLGEGGTIKGSTDYVFINTKIINGVDYTGDFLTDRPKWLDILAFSWSSDWVENALSLIGIGEDLNEKAARKSIESLIKSTLENRHTLSDVSDVVTDAMTPEEFKNFKTVVDYTVKHQKVCNDLELAGLLHMDVSEITECDYLKILRTQTDWKFYKELSNGLDSTLGVFADGVKLADFSMEIIGKVSNNYTEDLKYLEYIRTAMVEGGYDQEVVNQTINKLEEEYSNQAATALEYGFDKLARFGVDEIFPKSTKLLYKQGAKAVVGETLKLVDLSLAAKDLGCVVSGLDKTAENIAMIYTTQQYSGALIEQYECYANKICLGNYTEEDIEKCKIYFDLAKNAKIQEYESIANLYDAAIKDAEMDIQHALRYDPEFVDDISNAKNAAVGAKSELSSEITRLKGSKCFAEIVVGGGGSSGGRGSSRSF